MGRTRPDVSITADVGCPFHGRPAVTSAYRHSTPTCARAADHSRRFLVEQWSAASLIVALCMYLRVAYATSHQNGLDLLDRTRPSNLPCLWLLYRYLSTCSTSLASIVTFVRIFISFLSILSSNSTIAPLGNLTTPIS